MAGRLEPAERPKHWRFVRPIPTDSQGKRVQARLRELFRAEAPADALKEALACEILAIDEAEAQLSLLIDPALPWFRGHFPGRPILPGIAQAHIAALLARELWGSWPRGAGMVRVKFRRVLRPNDAVLLRLRRDEVLGRLEFSFRLGEIKASQGVIGGAARAAGGDVSMAASGGA